MRTVIALAALLLLVAGPAAAQGQGVSVLGTFEDWTAYSYEEEGTTVCYIGSQPVKEEGDYTSRGDVAALVAQRPARNSRDVFSIVAGYTYRPGSEVTVTIGGLNSKLFTKGDRAWARDSKTDQQLVQAMIRGLTMEVKGISSRGTNTTDTFSLRGFTDAYNKSLEACGIS